MTRVAPTPYPTAKCRESGTNVALPCAVLLLAAIGCAGQGDQAPAAMMGGGAATNWARGNAVATPLRATLSARPGAPSAP